MIAAIFVHFDKDNIIDPYVLWYLDHLSSFVDKVIVISNSDLSHVEQEKVRAINCDIVCRANEGYDFYAYKTGIDMLNYDQLDSLIICNDSVYGPFLSLSELYKSMQTKVTSFWSISDSYEVHYHLQSYFIVFSKAVLSSKAFSEFWANVDILEDKKQIIEKYEIGLSRHLEQAGFKGEAYIPSKEVVTNATMVNERRLAIQKSISNLLRGKFPDNFWKKLKLLTTPRVNPTIHSWQSILTHKGAPFVKRSVFDAFRKDRKAMLANLSDWLVEIKSDYPIELITNHLNRME